MNEIIIRIVPIDAATSIGLYDVFIDGDQVGDTVPTAEVRPMVDDALDGAGIR